MVGSTGRDDIPVAFISQNLAVRKPTKFGFDSHGITSIPSGGQP